VPLAGLEPPRDLLKLVEHELVKLSLGGAEAHVREEAIAQQYGVSRSAMRNILHRLAGLGLLTHIPRRGWRVRPFRQADLEAFLDVRELLELKALDLARDRLEPQRIQEILDRNQLPTRPGEAPQNDNSLHAYIIEQAGNPYISDFFERHGRYYAILFEWEDQNEAAAVQAVEQHRQILSAILRQDWEAARSLLAWHIRSNHPVLGKIVGDA
jgi:DNA-binding GntR family transcriptional regulator